MQPDPQLRPLEDMPLAPHCWGVLAQQYFHSTCCNCLQRIWPHVSAAQVAVGSGGQGQAYLHVLMLAAVHHQPCAAGKTI